MLRFALRLPCPKSTVAKTLCIIDLRLEVVTQMRLVKRGGRYSIVYEEAGRQRWVATGLTDRAAAEQLIVKERKKQERLRAGLAPATENQNLKLLVAIKGFMKRKRQLSKAQQKALRRRLLVS